MTELLRPSRAITGMTSLRASPSAPTDAEAIARSRSDPAAFELVFERHLAAVHAYAQRRVGRDLAEEVTAETFTRGFEARKRYDTSHPGALPWLLGIAGNVMRRHWRTEHRRLEAYARAAGPERPVDAPDDAGEIIAAVAELPRRYREVVLLWAWPTFPMTRSRTHSTFRSAPCARASRGRAAACGRARARRAPRGPRTTIPRSSPVSELETLRAARRRWSRSPTPRPRACAPASAARPGGRRRACAARACWPRR